MSSHYLKCAVKGSFENVFEVLTKVFGNIYAKKFGDSREPFKGIILGEEYFFRVNSDVAILIILEKRSAEETEIEIISCAGGSGLARISYSAHSAYAHKVKDFLMDSGFKVDVKEDIPYFTNFSYRLRTM
ncbi:MAG: hypothetical protein ACUVT9_01935 [Candidatus Bathycorpusculaceae bacterium]